MVEDSMQNIILIGHGVSDSISTDEMTSSLPASATRVVINPLLLNANQLPIAELNRVNWREAQRVEADGFANRLKSVLRENPDHQVVYFGLAPIPIAIYLGFLYGTTRPVSVFQKNHQTKQWDGVMGPVAPRKDFAKVTDSLREVIQADGDAVIRISVSYPIDRQHTLDIVPQPLAEIDISVPKPNPDSTQESDALESVAVAFREGLDKLMQFRPNVETVHLFVSAPVGVAFRLGTVISPTIHPDIMTYQFWNESAEKYRPAINLRADPRSQIIVRDEDRPGLQAIRVKWNEEIQKLKTLADSMKVVETKGIPCWFSCLFPNEAAAVETFSTLPELHPLNKTELPLSKVGKNLADGFRYEQSSREWSFSDELLLAFSRKFTSDSQIRRAGRLLLLHEAVHLSDHCLTDATAPQIGRFPKVLEAADYDADLWGLLHEYRFSREILKDTQDQRLLFCEIVATAIDSFWAFDDNGSDLSEIQVRRIQRYINWYWQLLAVGSSRSEFESLKSLAVKPHLEIAGPEIHAAGERVFFHLNGKYPGAELCVMHNNQIFRYSQGTASRVADIFDGFRRRSSEQVKGALKGAFDQIVTARNR